MISDDKIIKYNSDFSKDKQMVEVFFKKGIDELILTAKRLANTGNIVKPWKNWEFAIACNMTTDNIDDLNDIKKHISNFCNIFEAMFAESEDKVIKLDW